MERTRRAIRLFEACWPSLSDLCYLRLLCVKNRVRSFNRRQRSQRSSKGGQEAFTGRLPLSVRLGRCRTQDVRLTAENSGALPVSRDRPYLQLSGEGVKQTRLLRRRAWPYGATRRAWGGTPNALSDRSRFPSHDSPSFPTFVTFVSFVLKIGSLRVPLLPPACALRVKIPASVRSLGRLSFEQFRG